MKPGFELDLSRNMKDNMVRIMHEQYDQIIYFCKASHNETDKAVHEIRKSFKRLRAVLRLIRDEIGYSSYYRENAFCRDESKLLGKMRDLKVFHEDLESLAKDNQHTADLDFIGQLQKVMLDLKEIEYKNLTGSDLFQTIINDVEAAKERIRFFKFRNEGFSVIEPGLLRMYAKGYKELHVVKNESTTGHYHNLRKRVKYLMYFSQILKPLYPKYFNALDNDLDKAGDQLGLDHNFAELADFVENIRRKGISKQKKNVFKKWLQEIRKQLQADALEILEKIYVEDPKEFSQRIRQYYKIIYIQN